jgi:urease accessory protein
VQSCARIVATADGSRVGVPELRSAPPLTLRRVGPREIAIVSSAAWPVGGDDVVLDIAVGPGADLTVSSVAASLAYPSPNGSPSTFTVQVEVASGGTLRWQPEPTVLLARCDHRVATSIRLADGAALMWREDVRLGRAEEPTGSLRQRIVIDRGGRPLVRNELAVGPVWPAASTPAVLGPDCVAIATAYAVGAAAGPPRAGHGAGAAWSENPLAPDATAWSVVAGSMNVVRSTLTALVGQHRYGVGSSKPPAVRH